ncbi:phosphodiester glycosidase family protein [Prevotella sp. 10(H)]|uniref:phosphodiester glycosidase family protein n=1 Tax=Prevotella sp. 10(H) TaxID=1158294 RepID=UPI0004A71BBE|nr:phosphodiester glycosidase family protein [Prevotella sp. 10(H)]
MNLYKRIIFTILLISTIIVAVSFTTNCNSPIDDKVISYIADAKSQNIAFYWKDDSGKVIRSIQNLKIYEKRKGKELVFAMNGGMFDPSYAPQGLYIEKYKILKALDTSSGEGNFYLKPNGVFYITDNNIAAVCKTEDFIDNGNIKYATQSGPMLIIDGELHPALKEGSANIQIRNGVGILPDGKILFAISTAKVNFFDFASYFKSKGCKNALYLDGFVSRMYLPEKLLKPKDGDFGVIIGITK